MFLILWTFIWQPFLLVDLNSRSQQWAPNLRKHELEIKGRAGQAGGETREHSASAQDGVEFRLRATRVLWSAMISYLWCHFAVTWEPRVLPAQGQWPISQKAHFPKPKLQRCQCNPCWCFVSCYFSILCLIYSFWFYVFWHSPVYVGISPQFFKCYKTLIWGDKNNHKPCLLALTSSSFELSTHPFW